VQSIYKGDEMTAEKQTRIPEHFTEYDIDIMSNFDGRIDYSVADAIVGKPLFARYSAWDFNGIVWHTGEYWACEVWVYGSCRETVMAESLDTIMRTVSDEYGHR
jgi:hypothetical protein